MGLRAPALWAFSVVLTIVAFTGCKESETRPVKNAVSLELAACLGSGPAAEGDAGSGELSVCRERLDRESPEGDVNTCLLLRDVDVPDKIYRVALKWSEGRLTTVVDPLIDIAPGKTLEGDLYLMRAGGPASMCDTVQFNQGCGEGCLLRLRQPPTLLGQDASGENPTTLDFREGGQCTTEWGPPVAGTEPPAETCNGQDDDCDGRVDESLFCDGDCATDENCADRPGTPVCDTGTGRCVTCLPGTHAGCGADALCCEADGARTCRPTAVQGECQSCGTACGVGADACQGRTCVCGATGAACGGDTPICSGGVCVACTEHAQCGPNSLCCNGACQDTSLEACTDCGAGCAVGTATACRGRACVCGGVDACTGNAGLCLPIGPNGQSSCGECEDDLNCSFDATLTQCVGNRCRACDPMDHAGCVEASTTPFCNVNNTCVPCEDDGQCERRPGDLNFCLDDGACHQCALDPNNQLSTDNGCTPLAPFCDGGSCRPCASDEECPGLCVDGQCSGCDPDTNAGCTPEAPICNVNRICEPCSRDLNGDGEFIGDTDCNKGQPEDAPRRLCTVELTCEFCDQGDTHRGCGLDAICCAGAGGVIDCVPTEFEGGNGCETCGVACDADLSSACVDRQCICDVTGTACAAPQLCEPGTGICQNCRDNADCPLDSQCCNGLCLGTGPTAANLCTGCFVGPDSCNELGSSLCNDRVCECGNNAACGGDRPVCDDVLANGQPNPNVAQHTCVECLVDAHCAGQGTGSQCVNKRCVECDADPLSYDGCAERSAEPICLNGACRRCASSLDCLVRPGNLDQCDDGECVECLVVAAGEAAPGCNIGAPICDNNVCRPCQVSAECGVGRECVGGGCESCNPNGDVGCGGTQPICDDNSLRCRGCTADNECPAGDICTPGDGRCVACDLGSHRGCNNNQLCCGALPGQSCVALANNRCTSCNNGGCDLNTANRCAPRTGDNTVGSCDCGPQDACSGALAFCDGNAPTGGCVGCRADGDCVVAGLTQCVSNGAAVNGADPALCRPCDPDVAANLSGCDFGGTQPFCRRIGNIPNQQVLCQGCTADAECVGHPSGSQCVATGACRLCDPANGANSAGCVLSSNAPFCGNNFTCRGCANDGECAATAGNGNLCHEPSGNCFACNDGVRNGTETGIDCGGADCPTRCPTNQGCAVAGDCVSGVCTGAGAGRVCQAPTCVDTVRNGDETDVDCGGSCPNDCANGRRCLAAGDCLSQVCIGNICQAAGCFDGVRNGAETGVDCGGGTCATCPNGQRCSVANDCASGVCSGAGANRVCQAPTCNDMVRNGNETAVDCGGGTCPTCATGLACVNGARDCQSGVCPANNLCAAPACNDGVRNGTESAVDCGGPIANGCNRCPAGLACTAAADCLSNNCVGGLCVQAGCNDGILNNGETDIDCGNPCGATCLTGDDCAFGDRDCVNKRCVNNLCAAPVCAIGNNPGDLVRNGTETDLDCGGGAGCNACADGRACVNGQGVRDCISRVCTNSVCQVPTCNDGQLNGGEVGVDCRGPCPALCPAGQPCVAPADCASGVCTANTCRAPACNDGVRNGTETDVDCGGGACPACANGRTCSLGTDCTGTYCNTGICAACNATNNQGCPLTQICCRSADPQVLQHICRNTTANNTVGCTACTVGCDPLRANVCTNRGCRCGNLDPCAGNLYCVSGGEFGAGQCRACRNNNDCGGATPACVSGACQVCNASNDFGCAGATPECLNGTSCVECIDNGDCGGATPTCVNNVCRRCDTADDDGCVAPNPQCDNFQSCVECLANPDCVGNPDGAFCRAADRTCVQCLNAGQCDPTKADTCDAGTGTCRCGANAPCAGALICNAGACVACVNDANCGGATPACVANVCRTCDTADDQGCGGATPQCNNFTSCVECLANPDCVGNPDGEVCKAATNTCVECVNAGQCDAEKADTCDGTTNTCRCGANAPCAGALICNAGACVACVDDGDCGGATPACVGNTCRVCDTADDQGCSGATPQCNNFTSCVECLANPDCVGNPDGEVCKAATSTCVECVNAGQCDAEKADTCDGTTNSCRCGANAPCAGALICSAGACVACVDDGDCGGATPACVGNTCRVCDTADDQGCSGATPQCNNFTSCVECLVVGDCDAGEVCTNNACVPQ